jgi:uncharacterized protein YbaP (TraB family)
MKRFAIACALALLSAAPALARDSETFRPALFVARDADSEIYLYGTVHVRRPGTPWGGPRAQAALARAGEVWTEIEISPEAEARVQGVIMSMAMAPPDRPLSSWLNAEQNARLARVAQQLGAPVSMLEGMQPWFAGITLSVMPMMRAGYDPDAGVDRGVDAAADAAGIASRSFETMEQQLGFMAGLSDEAQRQMLLDAIDEAGKGTAEFDRLSAAWARGDLGAIETMVVDDTRREYPELYEALIAQRNRAWIDVLMREMDGAGVDFVAVGAGHIVGDDGLVAQLRAHGIHVERVE